MDEYVNRSKTITYVNVCSNYIRYLEIIVIHEEGGLHLPEAWNDFFTI